jgi:hypothetical protein
MWIAIAVVVCVAAAAVAVFLALSPDEKTATHNTSTSQTQTADGTNAAAGPIGPVAAADDAAAQVLVRNAMMALESAYMEVQTFDTATASPAVLQVLEPAITFVAVRGAGAATAPTAEAAADAVNYSGTESTYALGTVSASGRTFGVTVDKLTAGGTTYYVGGVAQEW